MFMFLMYCGLHASCASRGAQSTELVSLYIGYWTLNNYYYYYYSARIFKVCNSVIWPTHSKFDYGHIVLNYTAILCTVHWTRMLIYIGYWTLNIYYYYYVNAGWQQRVRLTCCNAHSSHIPAPWTTSRVQRYSSSMHRVMEEDMLRTRYDDESHDGHYFNTS